MCMYWCVFINYKIILYSFSLNDWPSTIGPLPFPLHDSPFTISHRDDWPSMIDHDTRRLVLDNWPSMIDHDTRRFSLEDLALTDDWPSTIYLRGWLSTIYPRRLASAVRYRAQHFPPIPHDIRRWWLALLGSKVSASPALSERAQLGLSKYMPT